MRYLAAQHQDLAVGLLTCVPGHQKHAALGGFALAFGPHGALAWKDLPQRHKDAFLDAPRAAPSIENPVITEFLAMLTSEDPRTIIDLLTARVEAVEAGTSPGAYGALPHAWPAALHFRDHGDFPDLLRCVREMANCGARLAVAALPGIRAVCHGGGRFRRADPPGHRRVPDRTGPQSGSKLSAASCGASPARWCGTWASYAAACAPRTHAAPRAWPRCRTPLHHAPFTGVRGAAMGQPYPHDVKQRDTAAQLAAQAVRGSVEEHFFGACLSPLRYGSTVTCQRSTSQPTAGTGNGGCG